MRSELKRLKRDMDNGRSAAVIPSTSQAGQKAAVAPKANLWKMVVPIYRNTTTAFLFLWLCFLPPVKPPI